MKEIFSSQGLVSGSMNDKENFSAKDEQKITSKGYGNTVREVKNEKLDNHKYRRNSAHTFHNKAGFYMQ